MKDFFKVHTYTIFHSHGVSKVRARDAKQARAAFNAMRHNTKVTIEKVKRN
jgi:hypothetical protein